LGLGLGFGFGLEPLLMAESMMKKIPARPRPDDAAFRVRTWFGSGSGVLGVGSGFGRFWLAGLRVRLS
jgi:hypothetical protein